MALDRAGPTGSATPLNGFPASDGIISDEKRRTMISEVSLGLTYKNNHGSLLYSAFRSLLLLVVLGHLDWWILDRDG